MSALINLIIFNFVFALLSALVGHLRSGNGSTGFGLGMLVGPFGLMMIAFSPTFRRGAPVQRLLVKSETPSNRNLSPWISYSILLAVGAAFACAILGGTIVSRHDHCIEITHAVPISAMPPIALLRGEPKTGVFSLGSRADS